MSGILTIFEFCKIKIILRSHKAMSGPSTSTAGMRKKTAEKRTPKHSKKDDPFSASLSLSKMMGGAAAEKQLNLEERSRSGVRALINEVGLRSTPAGVDMLAAYARQLTKDMLIRAHKAAEHSDRSQVEIEDVNLAFEALRPTVVSRVERGDIAKHINHQELPKLRDSALHLPVDRVCMLQPEFVTSVEKPKEVEGVPAKIPKLMKSSVATNQMSNILKKTDDVYD
uniref:Uncharacterized protein n=1 Tax=Panagrolaimus sp. JU765 TaxID=591449 RepID=A0AC34QC41_9BILA